LIFEERPHWPTQPSVASVAPTEAELGNIEQIRNHA
jgi:hypothetical protein